MRKKIMLACQDNRYQEKDTDTISKMRKQVDLKDRKKRNKEIQFHIILIIQVKPTAKKLK